MSQLIFAPRAELDLEGILEYISRDRPRAALRLVRSLRDTCRLLASNPELGERRPEYPGGEWRSFVAEKYAIYYRPIKGGVEVARIMHGARNVGPFE